MLLPYSFRSSEAEGTERRQALVYPSFGFVLRRQAGCSSRGKRVLLQSVARVESPLLGEYDSFWLQSLDCVL